MALNIEKIISDLEAARVRANQANQRRYEQGLAELRAGREQLRSYYDQSAGLIQDIGASATEDVNRYATRAQAAGEQDLISRGLANTTIRASMQRGVEDDRQRNLRTIDEQRRVALGGLAERRGLQEANLAGNITNFIAARDDLGPDPSIYANLIRSAQQSTQPIQTRTVYNRPTTSLRDSIGTFSTSSGGGGARGFTPASGGSGASTGWRGVSGSGGGATTISQPSMVNLTQNNLASGSGYVSGGGTTAAMGDVPYIPAGTFGMMRGHQPKTWADYNKIKQSYNRS